MLQRLYIKNLALIREQEITFTDGLNILTGETGAGKSVVIGSIQLALGEKADASFIREGAEYALIELVFDAAEEETGRILRQMEIAPEEGEVILQRKLYRGRSVSRLCGETVTLKQLRAVANELIRIHGQNDSLHLAEANAQARLLDDYAGEELQPALQRVGAYYKTYQEKKAAFERLNLDDVTRRRTKDLAEYEWKEITDAALRVGEDEHLEEEFRKMSLSDRIKEALSEAARLTGNDADGFGEAFGRALRALHAAESFAPSLAPLSSQLNEIDMLLQEFSRSVEQATADASFDEEDFANVTARLNLINRLKEKYGASIEDILSYADEKERQVQELSDLDTARQLAKEALDAAKDALLQESASLSVIRQAAAKRLSGEMVQAMEQLDFLQAGFDVRVTPDETSLKEDGYDAVSFFVSLNPGEPLKPLEKVASGGELSRLMLALQTVLHGSQSQTMIFDEIDAGVSGHAAWQVAERLGQLAKSRQLICITHLPQIAAMEDSHYLIAKQVDDDANEGVRTNSRIRRLTQEESDAELARLLGDTEHSLDNARAFRQEAERRKQSVTI